MEEKSADLLTVIIKFFNSALIYFSKDFFGKGVKVKTDNSGNLWKVTVKGPEIYDSAKESLDMAIREYEQAVMHLTACIVSGKLS
jgi:hypothetical protein